MQGWCPVLAQVLSIKREPDKSHDPHAVVVYYENRVVGHVPYNLALTLSAFLRREVNKGFAIVAGDNVNRGAGYGLEIPCTYRLSGGKQYVDRLKDIIDNWRTAGHVC